MFSFAGIFFTFFPFPEKKNEKKKDKAAFVIEIITSRDKRKDRPLALRGHVTSFLWKWKLHDFAFETLLVGHLLNKIIVIWFFKPAPFA